MENYKLILYHFPCTESNHWRAVLNSPPPLPPTLNHCYGREKGSSWGAQSRQGRQVAVGIRQPDLMPGPPSCLAPPSSVCPSCRLPSSHPLASTQLPAPPALHAVLPGDSVLVPLPLSACMLGPVLLPDISLTQHRSRVQYIIQQGARK